MHILRERIYIAPGQDEHLPHEGWHAVQQRQGRVPPTLQMKSGLAINEDDKLEKEADIMGGKAEKESSNGEIQIEENPRVVSNSINNNIIQKAANKKTQEKRKIRLWEPKSGTVAEVDADDTKTIDTLISQGYERTSKNENESWLLKVGNSNNKNDVTVLQKVLVISGYLNMPKDSTAQKHVHFGTYGELTKQAVMKFQDKKGLKADGIVGPDTWQAMELPWSKETNEPHRTHHQYHIILNNKNIYNDGNKAADNKTPSNEKTKAAGEIDYLTNIKSNLYILGYKNVYNDYKAARNQFLKDYFEKGHSLHADFIRMGEGEHHSSVLEWTNKALAHKITRNGKDAQREGKDDKELNNDIDLYYKLAMDYFNDPEVSWFIPYRSDVKYIWQFIDDNAKALGLSEYQVKLLKADYVFYSDCTVDNLTLMWNEINNPFDGWMLINATCPGYKAITNAKGIRNKIEGKIKGLKNNPNSIAQDKVKAKDTDKNKVKAKGTDRDKAKAKDTVKDTDSDKVKDKDKDKDKGTPKTTVPKNRLELNKELTNKGFSCKGTTEGGYVEYKHSDGTTVWVRPDGEIITVKKEWLPDGSKKVPVRYNWDGTPVKEGGHNTGEFVEKIDDATFLPPKK